jgi:hypothetical protein
VITLDPQTYQALLDQLDYLESKVQGKEKDPDDLDDLDSLVDEVKRTQSPAQNQSSQEPNLEDLSRQELVQYTIQQISEGIVTPLAVALEEIKINQEIDRLTRDEKYKDFWDYKDEIYRIARENPGLSLKRVYHLAKAEKEEQQKQETQRPKGRSREALLRHLPPVNTFGERPSGTPRGATEEEEPRSLREAAEKAFDEVMKGMKE